MRKRSSTSDQSIAVGCTEIPNGAAIAAAMASAPTGMAKTASQSIGTTRTRTIALMMATDSRQPPLTAAAMSAASNSPSGFGLGLPGMPAARSAQGYQDKQKARTRNKGKARRGLGRAMGAWMQPHPCRLHAAYKIHDEGLALVAVAGSDCSDLIPNSAMFGTRKGIRPLGGRRNEGLGRCESTSGAIHERGCGQ